MGEKAIYKDHKSLNFPITAPLDVVKLTDPQVYQNKMEDGGIRMAFDGGALREPSDGKGRYDLISPLALNRLMKFPGGDFKVRTDITGWDAIFGYINDFRCCPDNLDYLCEAVQATSIFLMTEDGRELMPEYYDRIHPYSLERLAKWYELGAKKYAERNWETGTSYSRCIDSAIRHLNRYMQGGRTEDHLAAVMWNLIAIIHYSEAGMTFFDDLPRYE